MGLCSLSVGTRTACRVGRLFMEFGVSSIFRTSYFHLLSSVTWGGSKRETFARLVELSLLLRALCIIRLLYVSPKPFL